MQVFNAGYDTHALVEAARLWEEALNATKKAVNAAQAQGQTKTQDNGDANTRFF